MKLCVIMPVGPGHETLQDRAMESVAVATTVGTGPFDDVKMKVIDDTRGEMGRSAARNMGVQASDADWLFFLDADDLMHPDAIDNFGRTEYEQLDAIWGLIMEYREGCMVERYQVSRIQTMEALLRHDPYLSIQMGHFVRRGAAMDTPFDEDMDAGEDWDYYLRLWESCRCMKVALPFHINNRGKNSVGPRSASGEQWRATVAELMEQRRK